MNLGGRIMKLWQLLQRFRKALLENDYAEQSRIAGELMTAEAAGLITEQTIVDLINDVCVAA